VDVGPEEAPDAKREADTAVALRGIMEALCVEKGAKTMQGFAVGSHPSPT
jgi:hypothetical protein